MDFKGNGVYLKNMVQELLSVDSPTGFTRAVVERTESLVSALGYPTRRTNRGNLAVSVEGRDDQTRIGICAHLDTLGFLVRSITEDGQLMIIPLGSPLLSSLDGAYCRIYTKGGQIYTGTILSLSPSVHVFPDASTRPRDEENMAVRIDETVCTRAEVQALGIRAGDYICYDPKTIFTDSGFLKSRFIDDKGCAAILITLLKWMRETGVKPQYHTDFFFTVHEEVGHGASALPHDLYELLVLDMGCVGGDLTCTEHQVSICAKDSGGPYDYEMVARLIHLAEQHEIDFAVDVYPHYTSDATALWRAGGDVRAALIGPGVSASHGMERTHMDGLLNTLKLAAVYLGCA